MKSTAESFPESQNKFRLIFSLQREYVLICFYDPECASSENVLDQLADSVKINEHLLGRRLDVLCVNVEGDTPS